MYKKTSTKTQTTLKYAMIAILALGTLIQMSSFAAAQKAHEFHNDDLDALPKYYEEKVGYMKKILHIQDLAIGLTAAIDPDIFYDYCEGRLDANWEERRLLRWFADAKEEFAKPQREIIEQNKDNLIRIHVIQLHKKSGLQATSQDDLYDALKSEIYRSNRRTKETKRRMLIHEMIWGISECKRALETAKAEQSGQKDTAPKESKKSAEKDAATLEPLSPKDHHQASLANYAALLAEQDAKSDALIVRLLRETANPKTPTPKPQTSSQKKSEKDPEKNNAEAAETDEG